MQLLAAATVTAGCTLLVDTDDLYGGEGFATDTSTSDGGPGDASADRGGPDHPDLPDLPDVPAGSKRVFVSSEMLEGNMGGIEGGDALCREAAAAAGLGGTWVAWLSTSKQEAIDRITHEGRYVRLDGKEVVANKAQLVGADLTNSISVNELGETTDPDYTKDVWTGTNATSPDGEGSSCDDWTSSNSLVMGSRGRSLSSASPTWTQVPGFALGGWGCQVACSVYCFEL